MFARSTKVCLGHECKHGPNVQSSAYKYARKCIKWGDKICGFAISSVGSKDPTSTFLSYPQNRRIAVLLHVKGPTIRSHRVTADLYGPYFDWKVWLDEPGGCWINVSICVQVDMKTIQSAQAVLLHFQIWVPTWSHCGEVIEFCIRHFDDQCAM